MVLLALSAGIAGGIYNSFVRGFLQQIGTYHSLLMPSTYLYAILSVSGAFLKLLLVNYAMQFYDQSEIGSIFSSFFIVFQISAGAFIQNEKSLYSYQEMLLLLLYSAICIFGIYLVTRKDFFSSLNIFQNKVVFGEKKE